MFYIVGNLENIDNSYNSMASSDIYGQPIVDTLQIRFVLFLVIVTTRLHNEMYLFQSDCVSSTL